MKIYDISQEFFSCKVYPGDPEPKSESLCSMENGDAYNLSAFSMCAHNGTHLDAPLHFIKNGRSVSEIPVQTFVGDAYVIHINGCIGQAEAKSILKKATSLGAGERILIGGQATVTQSGAEVFAGAKILLLGNESQTVGPEDAPMEVHKTLLRANVVLLEGIRLDGVSEGKYILCAAPLNLGGLEGAPCRAILIEK